MAQTQPHRYCGARRDRPDHRDYKVRFQQEEIPTDVTVDLCEYVDHAYSQGKLGSCTANAVCAAYKIDLHKQKLNKFDPSRLFLYYNTRKAEGKQNKDDGASLRDTVKALKNQGVCTETKWPYIISKFAIEPSEQSYQEAKGNIVSKYERIEKYWDKDQLRACLKAGFPFVFGFKVFPGFGDEVQLSRGEMKMPTDEERKGKYDGHAVVAVGYDDKKKTVKVLNSWTSQWGDNGYFYMPYDFITDPSLCFDFWKIEFVQEGQATSKPVSQQGAQIKGKETETETSARKGRPKRRARSSFCALL